MTLRTFLAHGALGNWDELIFLTVAIAFAILMAASWLRARARQSSDTSLIQQEGQPEADLTPRGRVELE
ncbi:MAG: hypothetical protein OXF22_04000 [Anaerolineaceae bacterium]|nr:hypothetical protein [Anaerolineaceae bacterium]